MRDVGHGQVAHHDGRLEHRIIYSAQVPVRPTGPASIGFARRTTGSGLRSPMVSTALASAPQQRKPQSRLPEREPETTSSISKDTGTSAGGPVPTSKSPPARKHGRVSSLSFCQRLASRNRVRMRFATRQRPGPLRRHPWASARVAPWHGHTTTANRLLRRRMEHPRTGRAPASPMRFDAHGLP
jgi:hypothetical protein